MRPWRLLIPAALVVLALAQAATALHWFGWGDPGGAATTKTGGR